MRRSHAFAKCIICNSGNINLKDVQEEVSRGNDIVRVPVKVLVCDSCGERYYERITLKRLEDLEEKILNSTFFILNIYLID